MSHSRPQAHSPLVTNSSADHVDPEPPRVPGEMDVPSGSTPTSASSDSRPLGDPHVAFTDGIGRSEKGNHSDKEDQPVTDDDASAVADQRKRRRLPELKWPKCLAWIPANMTWTKWKPVIRSAVSAWLSVIFLVIGPVENAMGQVCTFRLPPAA